MKVLRKLCVAIALTIAVAGTALADCPSPIPGEMIGPPCPSAQVIGDSANQAAPSAPISDSIEVVVLEVSIAGLENLLTVY